MADAPMKLTYFPVMAKGLGPALVCEFSGLPWVGPKDLGFTMEGWGDLKASGKCPFGQLPLLEADGLNIGQCLAIVNYVGKKAGTEGKFPEEFTMSQALIAEAEDLYSSLQKVQPTIFQKMETVGRDGFSKKGDQEALNKFWVTWVPEQLKNLEALLGDKAAFTSTGQTVGELYLWAMLHQMKLVKADMFAATPKLGSFYEALEQEPRVQKVLKGESTYGEWKQYFINP